MSDERSDVALPSWVAEAARLPIAFAQVREDPLLDAWVLDRVGPAARVLMIASGGCTLAYLVARCRLSHIDVVDPNPAQIALARLKLHLLQNCESADRMALLGHAPLPAAQREERLRVALHTIGIEPEAIGPPSEWSLEGPDHCGRYERVFRQLRKELEAHAGQVQQLLALSDPREQAQRVDPATSLGQALDNAFDRAMDLPILVRLFGEGATRNRVEPFTRHFARRTRHVLATMPAANNPYLWQVIAGRYPPAATALWLSEPSSPSEGGGRGGCSVLTTHPSPPTTHHSPTISWHNAYMTDVMARLKPGYDFVHLSNILDWLSPQEARTTLDLAYASLRQGGWTLIRQLNSTLDIPGLSTGIDWYTDEAQALHADDRSYFYRALHLGRKR
jgi:S-adenosylmethionine-diacylglycerol 3-amino-3-carboxypropyl transferase